MGRLKIESVIREMYMRKLHAKTNQEAAFWQRLITRLEAGIADYEEQLQIAKMIGDRNPEFDGDMVGRPDDDFAD